jgi:hypothetical protein
MLLLLLLLAAADAVAVLLAQQPRQRHKPASIHNSTKFQTPAALLEF